MNNQLFSHVFLVLKIGLLRLFKPIESDTTLPLGYDGYVLETVLKTFPCGIGIYKNDQGNKALIKVWRGSARTYEYYQFLKEIRLYELLHLVLNRVGPSLEDKYKNVRIPRLLKTEISHRHIIAIFEYMQDCVQLSSVVSLKEKYQAYSLAVDFWKYVGGCLTDIERRKLPLRNLANTLFIYGLVLMYAIARYPKHFMALTRSVPMVIRAIPSLRATWSEDLIHRDFHFDNVLVGKNYIAIIDFGDNALTHLLHVFAYSLHWEWDNEDSRKVILKKIVSLYGRTKETNNMFRAIFAMSSVQLLHDTGSKKRLALNFRCFDGVIYRWNEFATVLSGEVIFE